MAEQGQNEGNVRQQKADPDASQKRSQKPGATGVVEEAADSVRGGLKDTGNMLERETPNLATAALIGTGVAILEPELIPGVLIGVGATLAPRLFPAVGTLLRPVVKLVVKTGYELTSGVWELAAEVREQVEDIVAEAQAEREERLRRTPGEREAAPEAPGERPRRAQPQPT
jgi:hypothetical protein